MDYIAKDIGEAVVAAGEVVGKTFDPSEVQDGGVQTF